MAAINLKELSNKPDILSPGHRACAGCTAATVLRQVTLAAQCPVVIGFATGCMEVVTTIYPYTAWRVPYVHNAFENVSATISGVEAAYNVLKKQGLMKERIAFLAFGGDGGTYDIGLQSLSGALERGHNFTYICYNNESYANTGVQRSSATPLGASSTTCPAGSAIPGKPQKSKDLTGIIAAHKIPYVAQASPHNWRDLMTKVQKSIDAEGPAFINVFASCFRGWRFKAEDSIEICRQAVEACFWPLYEVENGVWKLNYKPRVKKPLVDWLKQQGRFAHLFKPGNEKILEQLQAEVDQDWADLLKKTGEEAKPA